VTERKQPRRFSRRDFLKWSGMGATGAILAACAPSTPQVIKETVEVEKTVEVETAVEVEKIVEVTPVPEPTTITCWWSNWGEYYNNLMKTIGDNFTLDAEPNITVEWSYNEDWQQKLITAVAAGNPPDTCYLGEGAASTLGAQGVLVPLNSYVAEAGYKEEDFVAAMWAMSNYEGVLFALPGGADAKLLVYSKDVYRDVGLDPEAPPKSIPEITEHSLQMLTYDADGNIDRMGYDPQPYDIKYLVAVFDGEWYDPGEQKVTANAPEIVECFEWLQDYVEELGFDKKAEWAQANPGAYAEDNLFARGKWGTFIDGFWVYSALDDFSLDVDYGIAYLPTLDGSLEGRNNYAVGGWMMGMPVGGKQPDAAWRYLRYGFLDYAWKMGCNTLNGCSVIPQMEKMNDCLRDKVGPENRFYPYIDINNDTLRTATKYWPVMPASSFYWDEMVKTFEVIMRGVKEPKEALDELTEVVQAELDRSLSL